MSQQQKGSERVKEEEQEQGRIYGKMDCDICGKGDAKRCKGCGTVAYCGRECQSAGWKKHRRECGRGFMSRKKREEEGEGEMKVPYETI